MILLLLFALIAGAGTAITPCVLPVLPALLSASAAGGRRRPLGIVLGLGITFTIAIAIKVVQQRRWSPYETQDWPCPRCYSTCRRCRRQVYSQS